MKEEEFYGLMTERVAAWLREQPEVNPDSVERVNMHTVAAAFDGRRVEVALQHDAASPHGDRRRG